MYWRDNPVVGVEEAELPQFTIEDHETNERKIRLATGKNLTPFIKLHSILHSIKFCTTRKPSIISILFQEPINVCHCHLDSNVTLGISCSKHIFRQS